MKIKGLRWLMVGLIFLATVINYIDRQTVSVLKTSISQDLGLSNADYAAIQNSFLLFYGISQIVSGRLYDVIGTRLGFVFSIVVWSGAALAHAAARTAMSFGVFRGHARFRRSGQLARRRQGRRRVVPGPRARARHGNLQHRRGVRRCALASHHRVAGDRLRLARNLHRHRRAGLHLARPVARVLPGRPASIPGLPKRSARTSWTARRATTSGPAWRPGWLQLLTYRQTWAVVMGRFITDPIWWLYIFWLPSYLQEARGFSLRQVGQSAWLPFLAAGIGALSGGYASGALISRGWTVDRARKAVMIFGALLTSAGILAMRASDPYVALGWMAVVLFGFQVWVNNLQTLPSDFFPNTAVGSVFGLGGAAAALASILFTWGTGHVVDALGYTPVFVVAGLLGPLGTGGDVVAGGPNRHGRDRTEGTDAHDKPTRIAAAASPRVAGGIPRVGAGDHPHLRRAARAQGGAEA